MWGQPLRLSGREKLDNSCVVEACLRYTATMPGKRGFEDQLAALDALRQEPEDARIAPLRKALAHRNNFMVAKAADIVREVGIAALIPELLTAFDRFFDNPAKSDPQCWAKNALSRALAALDYQEPEIYLRGMRHIQMEPVWGGSSDAAGTLRATCALALVQCRSLTDTALLEHLIELLNDKEKFVRAEAVRAIEQVGAPIASLLLRSRAVIGGDEPEVLGACYSGILRLDGVSAIPWITRFLASADDAAAEAALAIAGTHSPDGFAALRESFVKADEKNNDPWWRSALLSAIALTRQDAAMEFLFELVRAESLNAEAAIEAILRSMPGEEMIQRLQQLVAGNPRLARVVAANQADSK
jgi:hypothetical protein